MSQSPLLEVKNLDVSFRFGDRRLHALRNVSLEVIPGEVLGLVGESGSGKSTVAKTVMGLNSVDRGEIHFAGAEITRLAPAARRAMWRRAQMIFQDPYNSLNPRMTVGQILAEPLDAHRLGTRSEITARTEALLAEVGLPAESLSRYPNQFSGGQRQRVAIARALALSPELLIADEPVSALDVSVQAQIVTLFKETQKRRQLSLLIIAHDLALLYHVADRLVVMYAGEVVEEGPTRAIVAAPAHPYTLSLLQASPDPVPGSWTGSILKAGEPPSPFAPAVGCAFASRCPIVRPACLTERPRLRVTPETTAAGHRTACLFPEDLTAKGLMR